MADSIKLAIHHKHLHPSDSYKLVAEWFQVKKTTLYSRIKGTQCAPGVNIPQALSVKQERALVDQISQFATRITLLTPSLVHEYSEVLAEQKLGLNWVGRSIRCHKDVINSRFFAYKETAHLKANTLETRRAFYSLICDLKELEAESVDEISQQHQLTRPLMYLQHEQDQLP